jgi:hypothetical protein
MTRDNRGNVQPMPKTGVAKPSSDGQPEPSKSERSGMMPDDQRHQKSAADKT